MAEAEQGAEDAAWAEELEREPYNVRLWCAYLDAQLSAKPTVRFAAYERALSKLPGSYKVRRSSFVFFNFSSADNNLHIG